MTKDATKADKNVCPTKSRVVRALWGSRVVSSRRIRGGALVAELPALCPGVLVGARMGRPHGFGSFVSMLGERRLLGGEVFLGFAYQVEAAGDADQVFSGYGSVGDG
jgi:hypothetical protein